MKKYDIKEKNINSIFDDEIENEEFREGVAMAFQFVIDHSEIILDNGGILLLKRIIISRQMNSEHKSGAIAFLDFLEGKRNKEGMLEEILQMAINWYTLGDEKPLEFLNRIEEIKLIIIEDDNVQIFLKEGKNIRFSLLSKYLEDFADADEDTIKMLETTERIGKCHHGSISTSQFLNDTNDVVSGWVYSFKKYRFLHSWIEATIGKKEVAIDFTLNTIMNKDGYQYLTKAKEINRISQKKIKKDFETGMFNKMSKLDFGDKEYVFFRDQIIEDVERLFGTIER